MQVRRAIGEPGVNAIGEPGVKARFLLEFYHAPGRASPRAALGHGL